MPHSPSLPGFVFACTAAFAAAGVGEEFDRAWGKLTAEYHRTLDEQGVVGSSLMFVHRGQVVGRAVHGHADLDSGRKVDEQTIFHWASITKTFTGTAILQLRDRGRLSLDDPIVHYLPELRQIHDPDGHLDRITLRHLLSHSAGFRTPTWPWGGEAWHPHEPTRWEQIVAMLPYTRLHFAPGSRSMYSNPGIVFLGRVIEILSGDDYETYMHKNVLTPLGMHDSYFDRTPYHLLEHRSNNYSVENGERRANGLDFDTGITVSNGGLNAPLPDMVRYLTFLTGDADERGRAVLARSSLEEMWQPVLDLESTEGMPTSMGLTWFLLRHDERRFVGHTGGQKAFVSFVYVQPGTHTAAVVAFNTLGQGTPRQPDTRAILAWLRGALFSRIFALFATD